MADMSYKRLYSEDKFARDYYCKHARLGQLHMDKKREEKAVRAAGKKTIDEWRKEEAAWQL